MQKTVYKNFIDTGSVNDLIGLNSKHDLMDGKIKSLGELYKIKKPKLHTRAGQ